MHLIRCLGLSLCCIVTALAADALDRTITINIWKDAPSALLQEINAHLPPHERLAWFVGPATDVAKTPGPVLELKDTAIKEVLDKYCEATGLQWASDRRCVWIWQASSEQDLADAAENLAGDAATKAAAIQKLVLAANPASLTLLIERWAAGDQDAHQAIRLFLGISPATRPRSLEEGFNIFGDPDRSKRRCAVLGEYGSKMAGPWAAAAVLANGESKAALEGLYATAKPLSADLPLLVFAAGGRTEAGKAALQTWAKEPWNTGHGGWVKGSSPSKKKPGHIDGPWQVRATAGTAGSVLGKLYGGSEAAPDYQAQAADLTAKLGNLDAGKMAELRKQIQAIDVELQPLKKDKKKRKEFAAKIKELENQRKPLAGKLSSMDKALKDSPKILDRFNSYGVESAQALAGIVQDSKLDPLLREGAAKKLQLYREASIVPGLVAVCRTDEQPRVRQAVALTLGSSRLTDAVAALKEDLGNEQSPSARRNAIRGLAMSGHPEAGQWVKDLLGKLSEGEERQIVMQYLGLFPGQDIEDYLIGIATGDGVMHDRLSATAALTRSTSASAEEALVKLILDAETPLGLRQTALQGFTPKVVADVDRCYRVLRQTLAGTKEEALASPVVENLQRCARLMAKADPRSLTIAKDAVAVIKDPEQTNNVRKLALNTFKYTANDDEVLSELKAVEEATKNPIMKKFVRIAVKRVEQSLASAPQ